MTRVHPALRRLRASCLALPATSETASWGHPNFKAGKLTFATFEWIGVRPSIAFRLDPVDVDLLRRRRQFFATPYGRGQWVSLWADGRVNWRFAERLLRRSHRLVLPRLRDPAATKRSVATRRRR